MSKEVSTLPLLDGFPEDYEWVFFGNSVGGFSTYRYARRKWGDIKGGKKPLIGVVGNGTAKDPTPNQSIFQHDDLKGLGATNAGRIKIEIDNVIQTNFGNNSSFTFDNDAGAIDLDIGNNAKWVTGSGLFIDLNQ